LVVIAIIAILATLLLPALASARQRNFSIVCLSNARQLTLGWRMYSDDHSGQLINNFGKSWIDITAGIVDPGRKDFYNWANNNMDWTSDTMNFDPSYLGNGIMAPYLRTNLSVYKCPADNFLSPPQAGKPPRTRTMAMNAFFGPYGYRKETYPGAKDYYTGKNNNYSSYRQWLMFDQIRQPSGFFVMIDEQPDTLNDGLFNNNPDWVSATRWNDAPGALHGGGAGVAFADGHAEIHHWASAATKLPVTYVNMPDRIIMMPPFDADAREDYHWMTTRQAVLYPNF
jgi:prepilin-type processing-associated H-X9-DG protein